MTNRVTIGRAEESRTYEPTQELKGPDHLPDLIRAAVYEAVRADKGPGPLRCSVSLTGPSAGGVRVVTRFTFTVS